MTDLQRFTVRFDWRVNALAILLMPVLLSLGFWQLDRAEEKRQLQTVFESKQLSGPVPIESANPDSDLRYQPVRLKGSYDPDRVIFLDNRIVNGRFGYEVVMPFRLDSQPLTVLVNRGWIAGDKSRRSLPALAPVTGSYELTGTVYVPSGKLLVLADEGGLEWPLVSQSLDMERLQTAFTEPLFPYSVRLDELAPTSLQASWDVVNLNPEKHTGYAVQWFAMSATLVIIALLANTNLWALITRRSD